MKADLREGLRTDRIRATQAGADIRTAERAGLIVVSRYRGRALGWELTTKGRALAAKL